MEKVFCNDKENEIVNEESEESCGLIFPFKIQVSYPFHIFFKSIGTNYKSSHQDLFNPC